MQLNLLAGAILFALPLNASQDDALSVIDQIAQHFGNDLAGTSSITPQQAAQSDTNADATSNDDSLDADGLPWDERIHAGTGSDNSGTKPRNDRGEESVHFVKVRARAKVAGGVEQLRPEGKLPHQFVLFEKTKIRIVREGLFHHAFILLRFE